MVTPARISELKTIIRQSKGDLTYSQIQARMKRDPHTGRVPSVGALHATAVKLGVREVCRSTKPYLTENNKEVRHEWCVEKQDNADECEADIDEKWLEDATWEVD